MQANDLIAEYAQAVEASLMNETPGAYRRRLVAGQQLLEHMLTEARDAARYAHLEALLIRGQWPMEFRGFIDDANGPSLRYRFRNCSR